MRKILLLLLILLPGSSYALCSLSAPAASFGPQTTFYVQSTVVPTSSTTNVNCGTGTLNLLGTDYIAYAFTTASYLTGTRATMKATAAGTDNVPIELCIDSACATELQQGGSYRWNSSACWGWAIALILIFRSISAPCRAR
ncbi:spore coat protein U domain-containing protein [Pantoea wallisii]|uniref:spore coat protein U domain-containing protein n=1 Tax=Pantoea wallisii TaxID=1076551 RepID=UPI002682777F